MQTKKSSIKNIYLGIKFAFSYFSIIPIKFKDNDNLAHQEVLATMLTTLPMVGFILSSITVILYLTLEQLSWYGAIFSIIFYMLLYGFIHTEAIIDVVDATYAKHSGKDAYIIIKEPTVGAIGVLYGTGLSLLKIAGIIYLLLNNYLLEFIAITMVSRFSLLVVIKINQFHSEFIQQLKESLSYKYIAISMIITIIIGLFLTPSFIYILIAGVALSIAIMQLIKSKLGFLNGDALGATLEGIEILLPLFIVLLISR